MLLMLIIVLSMLGMSASMLTKPHTGNSIQLGMLAFPPTHTAE